MLTDNRVRQVAGMLIMFSALLRFIPSIEYVTLSEWIFHLSLVATVIASTGMFLGLPKQPTSGLIMGTFTGGMLAILFLLAVGLFALSLIPGSDIGELTGAGSWVAANGMACALVAWLTYRKFQSLQSAGLLVPGGNPANEDAAASEPIPLTRAILTILGALLVVLGVYKLYLTNALLSGLPAERSELFISVNAMIAGSALAFLGLERTRQAQTMVLGIAGMATVIANGVLVLS